MKPAVEWISSPSRPRLDLPSRRATMSSARPTTSSVEPRTNSPGCSMNGWSGCRLDRSGQVRLIRLGIDVGVAMVLEHSERRITLEVDARRLNHRRVVRVDRDATGFDGLFDGSIREDHSSSRRCSLVPADRPARRPGGADEGNRTPIPSLGSLCSAVELHPPGLLIVDREDSSGISAIRRSQSARLLSW